ncbi:MAG TPA: ATP-dependent DNA helicase RecG [Thermomicrobiales bacterium]|nr:ATP-dependent DNA helicase RecG [Thermomicrobiales bacterium]
MALDLEQADRQALIQLQKVLELERRKGFQDAAASNGLSAFAGERVRRLLPVLDSEGQRILREIDGLLDGYGRMGVENRQRCAEEALRLVSGLVSTARLGERVQAREASAAPRRPENRKPAARRATKAVPPPRGVSSLSDPVTLLPGVGPSRARQLEALGVTTIRDLLYLHPRRYIDYSRIEPISNLVFGRISTIQGTVTAIDQRPTRTGKTLVEVVVSDETGSIRCIFFNPYIERQLGLGSRVSMSGRVEQMRGTLCFKSPEWEELRPDSIHTGRIVPVYPLTRGLPQKTLRGIVRAALDRGLGLVEEYLPQATLERVTNPPLIPLADALEWMHYPDGETPDEARRRWKLAKSRLAFDEFLSLQLGLLQRKQGWQSEPGIAFEPPEGTVERFVDALPFQLTGAQQRALKDILADMRAPEPMTRLLQGDVGSGKTAVAAAACFVAARCGYQAALMAPTELLAEQHMRSLARLFEGLDEDERPRVALITGSTTGAERREVYAAIASGECDIAVGTQALIQQGVEFHRLGLAIIDEQHRFGVEQRAALRQKGISPDVLVMTATPIPRSLALTLHGDLDVTTLDELPPGRQPIETRWLQGRERLWAYGFVRERVQAGEQAFIVFPLVEESEAVDARAAVDEHIRLSNEIFPDLRLGLLHGRMKPAEKDEVMLAFRDHEIDVLVSTSVVEVGIDVPNATVMLIEGADRFGLAQLHQFRGRVGRGERKSYCLLVTDKVSAEAETRLQAMVDSDDGFRLAQIDLEMRGPGDFLGTRQSGLPEFQLADFADVRDLERARAEAEQILASDPALEKAEHALLRARVERFWRTVERAEVS